MAMHEYRKRYLDQLSVRYGKRRIVVDLVETDRIEAVDEGVRLYTQDRTYRYDAPLGAILKDLDPSVFVQVSETLAVNLDGVTDFDLLPSGDCRLMLRDGSTVDARPSQGRLEAFRLPEENA